MKKVNVIVNIAPLGTTITPGFHAGVLDESGNIHLEGESGVLMAEDEDTLWSLIEQTNE